jgi:hypothetical protein
MSAKCQKAHWIASRKSTVQFREIGPNHREGIGAKLFAEVR